MGVFTVKMDAVRPADPVRGPSGIRPAERLDGWKAIAAYFGRDRTTVIRWARERGLPVHRIPGGRTGTVYAMRAELERWAGVPGATGEIQPPPAAQPPVAAAPARIDTRRRLMVVGVVIAGIAATYRMADRALPAALPAAIALPADPAVATQFIAARDLVAERSSPSIERGIAMLEQVTAAAPDFAEGHAALAEALLLSREFGGRSDEAAFARARASAGIAVRLAPGQASGYRLLGFIAYWADRDFGEAQAQFRHATALAPGEVQNHFWLGNILSHHGEHAAALAELKRARLMQPGSVAIRTDHAWAMWAAGREAEAIAALHDIARRYPDFAVVQDCLSTIALVRGDDDAHARHFTAFARARGEPALLARAAAIAAARAAGPDALAGEIADQARRELRRPHVFERALAALVLTHAGAGDEVLAWARQPEGRDPNWGSAGMLARLRIAWRDRPPLLALLQDGVQRTA
ncbi:tetratricopeptide repeat protein [Sphingomonas silueang]|uniref:tetratricopeptide repeat protein n=1 Tax=Sphingomonas silueang TaxID=3156617 RepID=UPI0032B56E1A